MENRANHKTVVRIPNRLWDAVVKAAESDERSINQEVVYLVKMALGWIEGVSHEKG